MVEYKCFRCGYIGKQKSHLQNHLNRKKPCNILLEDISTEILKKIYNISNTKNVHKNSTQTAPKQHPNSTIICDKIAPKQHPNDTQTAPKQHLNDTQTKCTHECIYCKKLLTRKSGLTKHLKICKKKINIEKIESDRIKEMENKIKELEEKINCKGNTNIINTTNNNINNSRNIIINNYGEENIKHLRSKDYASLLKGIYSAVPKLIQQIHFDPEHPENHNIKFTNKKFPYLKVMKEDKWQLVDKKTELLDLIDNKCYLLREKYYNILEKNKYNISDNQKSIIDKFLDKYEEDDKQVLLDIINKTELVLLNNS